MALRSFKPITPGQRQLVLSDRSELTKKEPEKALLAPLRKRAGRNRQGRITVRHRGSGHKQMYRIIDFKRRGKAGVPGKVTAIEYDPNRSAYIALVEYPGSEKAYILCPQSLAVGDAVMAGPEAEVKPGNALPLGAIPTGTLVHNIEMQPGRGGQMVRSAGTAAQVMAKEGLYVTLRLPSGEMRRVLAECYATIGQVGRPEHQNINLGKAGRSRWLGKRPEVRGKAMSPRDHPHGGGEGRNPIGLKHPKTPWGKPALGAKTRRNKRSNKLILKRRKVGYGQVG